MEKKKYVSVSQIVHEKYTKSVLLYKLWYKLHCTPEAEFLKKLYKILNVGHLPSNLVQPVNLNCVVREIRFLIKLYNMEKVHKFI